MCVGVCVFACESVSTSTTMHRCRSKDSAQESVVCFSPPFEFETLVKVFRLGGKCLYLLSHSAIQNIGKTVKMCLVPSQVSGGGGRMIRSLVILHYVPSFKLAWAT